MSIPAENVAAPSTEVDSEVVDASGAESAPAATETGKTGKPPHDPDLQARFDKLTSEKYEGLSRAERAEYRAQLAEQKAAELEARLTAKPQQVAPAKFPTLEDHGYDEGKYAEAVAAFIQSQTQSVDPRQAAKEILEEERERAEAQTRMQAWERRQAEFVKTKPEYVEKVIEGARREAWALTADGLQVVQASEIGPEILLYLAENADKSREISRLPPILQAREIGRIERGLEAAKVAPPPVSKAPAPVAKIDAADSVKSVAPDDPDSDAAFNADEWAKRRNRQVEKRRG